MTNAWGMMGNDNLGDCTCAAMGHAVQTITSNGDGLITPPDAEIIKMYEGIGSYDPSDPNSDQGATELDAMKFMASTGLSGVKCDAFADVDHTNLDAVKQTIFLMGGCYIGVEITDRDMNDFEQNRAWTSTRLDRVEGGHALWVPIYDRNGIYVVTWGKLQPASWGWYQSHADEAHALILKAWCVNSLDCSPSGLDLQTLEADLAAL
jgi:hypothetical protein